MKKFKAGNTVKILKITQGYDGKFKVGDTGVVDRFQYDDSEYLVLIGDISNENCDDCWHDVDNIELAEDTSKPVFTSGEKVFIAQMNPHAGVESKRYYHAQFWCNSGHQRQYVELGLLFNNKKDAESKCRELVGLPPETKELIDGNAYMFNYQGIKGIGLYEKDESSFFMVGCSYNLENCTNIRPMTVAEIK